MAKKDRQESAAKMLRQFDALKEKHPDALLLFRTGDFYEAYGKDAVKAAAILAVEITDRILPDRKLQVASFPSRNLTRTCRSSSVPGQEWHCATRFRMMSGKRLTSRT